MTGIIKRIVADKGFGFILGTDNNERFFHKSAVADHKWEELVEGDKVEFIDGKGPKGPRAENVRVL
jgi:CspA family cold shock protein